MKIVNHGLWERYEPEVKPAWHPATVMYCRRVSDKIDWYDFHPTLNHDTVKATVDSGLVRAASREADRLFPQQAHVIEIYDIDNTDVQRIYGNKPFNLETNEFV
jgi:hypothetical protein